MNTAAAKSSFAHFSGLDKSEPVIVLESGSGMVLQDWHFLQQMLAEQALVLSYDRPGIGLHSRSTGDPAAASVTRNLEGLLSASEIQRPFVLVGYSLGGLYARHFAATHPDKVAALVLIDPSPDHGDLIGPAAAAWVTCSAWIIHALVRSGIARAVTKLAGLLMGKPQLDLPPSIRAFANLPHLRTVLREIRGFSQIQKQVSATPPAEPLPILCFSAGQRPKALTQGFDFSGHHATLAAAGAAPLSRHLIVDRASHASLLSNRENAETIGREMRAFMADLSLTSRS